MRHIICKYYSIWRNYFCICVTDIASITALVISCPCQEMGGHLFVCPSLCLVTQDVTCLVSRISPGIHHIFRQTRAQSLAIGDLKMVRFWWRSDNPFPYLAPTSHPLWCIFTEIAVVYQSSPDGSTLLLVELDISFAFAWWQHFLSRAAKFLCQGHFHSIQFCSICVLLTSHFLHVTKLLNVTVISHLSLLSIHVLDCC